MYSSLNLYSVRNFKYFYHNFLAILICTHLHSHSNFIEKLSVYQSTVYCLFFLARAGGLCLKSRDFSRLASPQNATINQIIKIKLS